MTTRRAEKDPDAVLDYTMSWADWLATGETVAASDWLISGPDAALTKGTASYSQSNSTTAATVWLIGGTLNQTYLVTNRITTNSTPPRIDDRTIRVVITQR